MCGGIGSRINLSFKISEKKIEKPLILLNNKPLIEHIIGTILNSKKQFRIFAAVSSNTKETEVFINDKYSDKIKVLKTSGRGYSEDFTNIISHFRNESYIKEQEKQCIQDNYLSNGQDIQNKVLEYIKILFLPIDLPLISTNTIESITELKQKTPLISIVIDKNVITENGFNPSPYVIKIGNKEYCYTGIAVVSLPYLSNLETNLSENEIEEEPIIFEDRELAFNINTIDDLEKTEEQFSKIRGQKKLETD